MRDNDYAVLIGRFQPIHKGHVRLIIDALNKANHVIIGVGSANSPRTPRNPFTFEERKAMITRELVGFENRITVEPLDDSLYTDSEWSQQVRSVVADVIVGHNNRPTQAKVALAGYAKDASSYYLKYFPEWVDITVKNQMFTYDSTVVREMFYEHYMSGKTNYLSPDMFFGEDIPISDTSSVWHNTDYQDILFSLAKEWDFNKKYDPSKYHINVITVDAVVLCNGHVLVVNRKFEPGKGLMALPGGHINKDETLENAMLRELREETKIDLSDKVLRRNIVEYKIFDHPKRSERGRVITTAYLIHLQDENKLPKVSGGDDASKAFWVPVFELKKENMFEDHYDIVMKLTKDK